MPAVTPSWTCPVCGRKFKQPTAEHSCTLYPLEHHLAGKPVEIAALCETYLAAVRELGDVSIEPVKTAILLRRLTNFGGVRVVKTGLRCSLLLPYLPDSLRLTSSMRYTPHKLACHFNVANLAELDDEVLGWMRDAFACAGGVLPPPDPRPPRRPRA